MKESVNSSNPPPSGSSGNSNRDGFVFGNKTCFGGTSESNDRNLAIQSLDNISTALRLLCALLEDSHIKNPSFNSKDLRFFDGFTVDKQMIINNARSAIDLAIKDFKNNKDFILEMYRLLLVDAKIK